MIMFMALAAAAAEVPSTDLCAVNQVGRVVCNAWAIGVADGVVAMSVTQGSKNGICIPDAGVSGEDVRDAIAAAQIAHPERASAVRELRIALALHDRWPCPQAAPKP